VYRCLGQQLASTPLTIAGVLVLIAASVFQAWAVDRALAAGWG